MSPNTTSQTKIKVPLNSYGDSQTHPVKYNSSNESAEGKSRKSQKNQQKNITLAVPYLHPSGGQFYC